MYPEERKEYMDIKEEMFNADLARVNLKIDEAKNDGNCLFRAFSYQIYGKSNWHRMIRDKCMRYIGVRRDHFGHFLEGGIESVNDYIKEKL